MLEKSNRSFSLPPPLLVWAIVLLVASILVVGQAASAAVDVEGRKCVHDAIENNNFRKAFEQACKMADHDCSYSQCILGLMYEKGVGVEKDVTKAVEWYTKAARRGFADAQFRLGRLYYLGKDVKRDPKKAALWLNKSAEQGVAQAQYYMGKMYLNGDGVPKNVQKARRWLHLAADRGIADAKRLIAKSHLAKEAIYQTKKVARGVSDHAKAGGRLYGQTLENTEMSWKGYADIVNALDKAAAGAGKVGN